MNALFRNPRTIASTFAIIMLAAIVGVSTYFTKSNSTVLKSLNNEKLKTEQLLSEKLRLEKDIAKMNQDLKNIQGEKAHLNSSLSKYTGELNQIKKSKGQVSQKSIKALNKEVAALKALKSSLAAELAVAKSRIQEMEGERSEMEKQLAMLNATNKKLSEDLAMMQGIAADQFNMAAYKGKSERLTVKAKKVDKLSTRFKVPSYVATNAGFKIRTPDGKVIDKTSKGMSMSIVDDIPETYASVEGIAPTETMKEIELTYTPDKKLKPGAYKIELYNGANYLTSCIINLK